MTVKPLVIAVSLVLSGCSAETTPATQGGASFFHEAAMSDDGLAVAADTSALVVNDGGRTYRVDVDGLVLFLEPGPSGVWAATLDSLYYVSRKGASRFDAPGAVSAVMPAAGATAYVIHDGELLFIGSGDPWPARRLTWERRSKEGDAGSSQDYGIHYYDR